jgi:hypothetical protein
MPAALKRSSIDIGVMLGERVGPLTLPARMDPHTLRYFTSADTGAGLLKSHLLTNAGLVQATMHDVNDRASLKSLHAESCEVILYGPQDTTFFKAVWIGGRTSPVSVLSISTLYGILESIRVRLL